MIQVGQLLISIDDREIRSNGESLRIGSRAFDILELLIRANGATVSKEEIMRRVWPNSVVEENNLHVHVATLRKALAGDRNLIRTVPGRGYRLITTCRTAATTPDTPAGSTLRPKHSARVHSPTLFGREGSISEIIDAVGAAKMVTLVGAGGIGKTCIASAVAARVEALFPDGVIFVPLDAVSDPRFAISALASTLGITMPAGRISIADIASSLTGRRILVLLDNCEHLIDVAAQMASAMSEASTDLCVLATSREPLRVPGELLYHVPPLDVPGERCGYDEILRASAVQLFTTRACAADVQFSLDERSVRLIGSICRRLDGIPLALELAAAHAAVLGLEVLVDHLDDQFRMLTGGLRTALPRHQTLKATLDWSYRLLEEPERTLLRWLGVFMDGFSFDAAYHAVNGCGLSRAQVLDALGGLVSKSLVNRACTDGLPRYRLLAITRAYALQQLENCGEQKAAALAHAIYFQAVFSQGPSLRRSQPTSSAVLAHLRLELGNLRAALDWAFSPGGNRVVGVSLAAVAAPYLFNESLVDECSERARVALEAMLDPELDPVPSQTRLRIQAMYAAARVFTNGPCEAVFDAWCKVLSQALAERDRDCQLFALWGLWTVRQYRGEARLALRQARRFCALAQSIDYPTFCIVGKRLVAVALHYNGEADAASEQFKEMLNTHDRLTDFRITAGFRFDHGIAARASLARVLWTQGNSEAALQLAQRALDEALKCGHDVLICYVLAEGLVPIALLTRSFEVARQGITLLENHARQAGFVIWLACCAGYEEYLNSTIHPDPLRLPHFRHALDAMRETGYLAPLTMLLAQYARCLNSYGCIDGALETLNEAFRHCEATGERWFYPELRKLATEIANATDSGQLALPGVATATNFKSSRRNGRSRVVGRAARPAGKMHGPLRLRTLRR
ncbi:transcriptional regulator [Paraburkholderia sp. CNPSo 3157]|uniref:Transcriptional regulator n=1 Tax=Paraburkholderia franconis TaxID=2654983 RepID=A0A7X1NLB8_9BURK|nr:winged helix-turn-helix domain-containing protein [Paraburkholderia franconis]MPW23796.1 transcriptional regulator [Paraburkholderia franconis]